MSKHIVLLSACSTVVVGCAVHPPEVAHLTEPCHTASADPSAPMPTALPEKLPPSNIFKLSYMYPEDLRRQHLQGRALVRLTLGETGKIGSAEFLKVEAPPPVESAMCGLLQRLQYDVSAPGFDTVDWRTFVIGIRYCLGNCSGVPAYPGFEKREIAITGSL
jgi:hypothetical protein